MKTGVVLGSSTRSEVSWVDTSEDSGSSSVFSKSWDPTLSRPFEFFIVMGLGCLVKLVRDISSMGL